jgi:hypothetical protein
VRRTTIYLTTVERAALDARAAAEGSSRSEVLRILLDRALNLDAKASGEVDAALADLAGDLADSSRRQTAGDSDLSSAR